MVLLSLLTVQLLSTVGPVSAASTQGQFLKTSGTQILDGTGNQIVLRGLNYYGYECDNMPNEMHTEADYARFASLGFNVVRLPVGWMWFEPRPGYFDTSYLNIVSKDIQWAKKYGLYIIIDMHQNLWSPRFLDSSDGNHGCGAPQWSVAQYPATNAGRFKAMANFWVNATLQAHYSDVWKKVASTFANEETVAGYDIMNEPPDPASYAWAIGMQLDSSYLTRFYVNVTNSIRSVDKNHMIFLEPTSEHVFPSNFPLKDNIVWSPHFYMLSFESHYDSSNLPALRTALDTDRATVQRYGTPIWIGEYGAFMSDSTYLNWLHDTVGLFKEYDLGSAWWPYHGGAGQQIPSPVLE
jgi:endoglycosylceramidase